MAGVPPEGLLTAEVQDFFTSYDDVYDSFDAMGLQEDLLRGIYAYGFEKPSAIQQRGIVPFCKGLDVIQQAQSGTGKTATFCMGILEQLDYSLVDCQALVLVPTFELAEQIEKVMRALGDYLGVKVHAIARWKNVCEDERILSAGVHVVVGLPGRVLYMLEKCLRADYIKIFVLDDFDEMLSFGFQDQIDYIFQLLPGKVQVGVSAATMTPEAVYLLQDRKECNHLAGLFMSRETGRNKVAKYDNLRAEQEVVKKKVHTASEPNCLDARSKFRAKPSGKQSMHPPPTFGSSHNLEE